MEPGTDVAVGMEWGGGGGCWPLQAHSSPIDLTFWPRAGV